MTARVQMVRAAELVPSLQHGAVLTFRSLQGRRCSPYGWWELMASLLASSSLCWNDDKGLTPCAGSSRQLIPAQGLQAPHSEQGAGHRSFT